ncbi:MAG TPA: GNAT family N-acetyltransferase, partial [Anaerolineaceae bacterium]|nr:GNAT family N-acetyltransferase [Anaerolineaceae bacterium]
MIPNELAEFQTSTGKTVLLRVLEEDDLTALEWEGQYSHFRKLYRQHYKNSLAGSTLIWVVTDRTGKVIGQVFIMLYAKDNEIADGKRRAYLFSFRIRDEWRGLGIGSFVMQYAEDFLREKGFSWLRLNVAKDNLKAIGIYLHRGYRIMGPDSGTWRYED